jgi:hypothetical protein
MASPAPKSDNEEATSDVQMEETQQVKDEADNAVQQAKALMRMLRKQMP